MAQLSLYEVNKSQINTALCFGGRCKVDKSGAIQNLNAGSPPQLGAGCRSTASSRRGIFSDRYRNSLNC